MNSTPFRSAPAHLAGVLARRRPRRAVALLLVVGSVLASGPPASSTSGVGAARNDLRSARRQLHRLDLELSLAAARLHEQKVLLATLRADLDAARTRSARADATAADAASAFDAMVRWSYESGVSTQLGLLGLGSVSDVSEGAGLLSAMVSHQQGVAAAAADARSRAAATDGQTTSLEAEVTNGLAAQRSAGRDLNAAAARQKELIGQLEQRLHHQIKLAIADRHAAQEAAREAAAEAARRAQQRQQPTGPSGPTTTGPTTTGPTTGPTTTGPTTTGPDGPLPGPSEPAPTTGEIVDLITSLWGTGYDGQVARCVGWRESRYQPTARNTSSGAAGLFQLMPFWWDGNNEFGWKFDPYDARQNAVHAHLIWKVYGWEPWTTGHLCV